MIQCTEGNKNNNTESMKRIPTKNEEEKEDEGEEPEEEFYSYLKYITVI